MTIKKRLFLSNLFMLLIPALVSVLILALSMLLFVNLFYKQAMDETTDMTSYYTAIDFVKNADGTWSVDEDAWNDELGFMFGIY